MLTVRCQAPSAIGPLMSVLMDVEMTANVQRVPVVSTLSAFLPLNVYVIVIAARVRSALTWVLASQGPVVVVMMNVASDNSVKTEAV